MRHRVQVWLAVLVMVAAACGSSGDAEYEVSDKLTTHETTQSIWVWAPDAEGSWPVVYALPGGFGDAKRDLEVLATELASHGIVVFGTYMPGSGGVGAFKQASECGYRFARSVAAEYGGDLSQPVTILGFSMGATGALYHGLDADYGPTGSYEECFTGAPRPDVVVSLAGCHLWGGFPAYMSEWGNRDADLVLVSGAEDAECPTEQTDYAQSELQEQGYEVTRIELADANHGEFIFLDADDNWQPVASDHPTSQEVVQIVLDAIEDGR